MSIKVLIVDDSHFFRRCIGDIINKADGLEVIDFAVNGQEGVDKALALKPDVVMMDIEMPVKNGIEATREIMAQSPMPILMFSSLTHEGAKATLDALEAGAADFLPKKFEEIAGSGKVAAELISSRIRALVRRRSSYAPRSATLTPRASTYTSAVKSTSPAANGLLGRSAPKRSLTKSVTTTSRTSPLTASGKRYNLLAIASSTGGPVALQTVLSKLPSNFPYPILLVQHMPKAFTSAFAERLDRICKISVKEAQHGDVIKAGHAYLAPGGQQMLLDRGNRLKVIDGPDHLNYKPSADFTFATIAKANDGNVLTIVLTGMGADGCDGAKLLNNNGATIWAQDEATSVVYGMPHAVKKAGLTSKVMPIDVIGDAIIKEMMNG